MGWLFFNGKSKTDLVNMLTTDESTESGSRKVLAHCVRGNVLWSVVECTRKDGCIKRYIRCDLLQKSGGEWGYKGMDESVHPLYYSCPLKYLKMAPEVTNQEWRDKVRVFHRKFEIGQRVKLNYCSIPWAEIISLRPLLGTYEGSCYRLKRDLIGSVL